MEKIKMPNLMAAVCVGFGLLFALIYFLSIQGEGGSQILILLFSSGIWFVVAGAIFLCRWFIRKEL
jgi:phosphoglycerol transferase MdoB-like AlkP superfamily enzyme